LESGGSFTAKVFPPSRLLSTSVRVAHPPGRLPSDHGSQSGHASPPWTGQSGFLKMVRLLHNRDTMVAT